MGFIYMLAHERIPGLVKIGYTTTTVDERVAQISGSTGVPGTFRVVAHYPTDSPVELEQRIFAALADVRLHPQKEFFETSIKHARNVIETILRGIEVEQRQIEVGQGALLVRESAHLGEAIRKARKASKLTQAQLAQLAGCGTRAVVEIEAGKQTAEVGLVLRLADAAGVQVLVQSGSHEPGESEASGLVIRLLTKRLGHLSSDRIQRIKRLPFESLGTLAEAIFEIDRDDDLTPWLG